MGYSCLFLSEILVLVWNHFYNMTSMEALHKYFNYNGVASLNKMDDTITYDQETVMIIKTVLQSAYIVGIP